MELPELTKVDGASGIYWHSRYHRSCGNAEPDQLLRYDTLPPRPLDSAMVLCNEPVETNSTQNLDNSIKETVERLFSFNPSNKTKAMEIINLIYGTRFTHASFKKFYTSRLDVHNIRTAIPKAIEEAFEGFDEDLEMITQGIQAQRKGGPRKPRSKKRKFPELVSCTYDTFQDVSHRNTIAVIQSPDTFRLAEELLHNIDLLPFQLFRSPGWRSDDLTLIPPRGIKSLNKEWKNISDKCWSAGGFFKGGKLAEGEKKLKLIYKDLEIALCFNDPHFLVRIWRIFRYIYGIDGNKKNSHLQKLLFHLVAIARSKYGIQSPIFGIFHAFSRMKGDDVLWSFRIGQLRAIQSLQKHIGGRHPIVLCMWSYYAKQWRLYSDYQMILPSGFRIAWEDAKRRFGSDSLQAISILHDFLYYAVYCRKEDAFLICDLAFHLHRDAGLGPKFLSEGYQWGSRAQFFAFAGKILAAHFKDTDEFQASLDHLRVTAETLEQGDVECKIRAKILWKQMANWSRKWGYWTEHSLAQRREGLITEEIQEGLQRMTC